MLFLSGLHRWVSSQRTKVWCKIQSWEMGRNCSWLLWFLSKYSETSYPTWMLNSDGWSQVVGVLTSPSISQCYSIHKSLLYKITIFPFQIQNMDLRGFFKMPHTAYQLPCHFLITRCVLGLTLLLLKMLRGVIYFHYNKSIIMSIHIKRNYRNIYSLCWNIPTKYSFCTTIQTDCSWIKYRTKKGKLFWINIIKII